MKSLTSSSNAMPGRWLFGRLGALTLTLILAACGGPTPTPSPVPSPTTSASPTATPTPSPSPTPSPVPTPVLVPAPLTGLLVSPELAAHHPIAVMIDDLDAARPQSGFNAASVVWQAPAEGGIPRYMFIYGENIPTDVGPVRSARYYYIAWAAEWRALYVHAGGSPQALSTLRAKGNGDLVYNADGLTTAAGYFRRIKTRPAPHNLYTTGKQLRTLAAKLKATDGPMAPVWIFAPDLALALRPTGGAIDVSYPANKIHYAYDRASNTYLRTVTGEKKEIDAATKKRVAPKNVIIMLMKFGPLTDGGGHGRLEADVVGSGTAWIATNGTTIKGTWRKDSLTAPTLFFDTTGAPAVLTAGQTFVQVMPIGSLIKIKDGKVLASPIPVPSPSPTGS